MKIIKRIFTVLLLVVIVLIAITTVVLKTGYFTSSIKEYIEAELIRNSGKDIKIGKIELGVFNNIVIKDISLPVGRTFAQGGEFARIGSIIIRFNLFDIIIKKRDIEKTLSHIIIDSPVFFIAKENGTFNVEDFAGSFKKEPEESKGKGKKKKKSIDIPVPVNKIIIENGRISYKDKDLDFSTDISSIKGSVNLNLKKKNIKSYLSGKTKYSIRRNTSINLLYFMKSGRFKADLVLENGDVHHWSSYALKTGKIKANDGDFSLELKMSGKELNPEKMEIDGKFSINEGVVEMGNGFTIHDVNTEMSLGKGILSLEKFNFTAYDGVGEAKGKIEDIFRTQKYNGSVVFNNVDLSKVDNKIFDGKARAALSVSGKGSDSVVKGSVFLDEGRISESPLQDIEINLAIENNRVRIDSMEGKVAGGRLDGKGYIYLSGKNRIQMKAELIGLDTAKVKKGLAGKADLWVNIGGSYEKPELTARFKSEALEAWDEKIENISSMFRVEKGSINVYGETGFDYKNYKSMTLTTKVVFSDEKIEIPGISLDQGGENLVSAGGYYTKKDKSLNMFVDIDRINISKMDIDYFEGKKVDGTLRAKLDIKGTSDSPLVDLKINLDDLLVKGEMYKLSTEVLYADKIVTLSSFKLNNNLSGAGKFSIKKQIFDIDMNINGLSGNAVEEITGLELFGNSTIDGNINVKKESDGYGGNVLVDVKYNEGLYEKFDVDVTGEKNEFTVNKIYIRQQKGFLDIGGRCFVRRDGGIVLQTKGKMRDYVINKNLKLRADFLQNSKIILTEELKETSTKIKATDVLFNSKKIEDVDVFLRSIDYNIADFEFTSGETYKVSGKFTAGKVPRIEADLKLKSADMYPVYKILGNSRKGLDEDSSLTADIKVRGKIDNASVSGEIAQKAGRIYLGGNVSVINRKGILKLDRVNIKYNAENADLQRMASVVDKKFEHSGRLNGEGFLKGELDDLSSGGELMMSEGVVGGIAYDELSLKYLLDKKKITIDRGLLGYKKTYLNFGGTSLEFRENDELYATIKTRMENFKLSGHLLNGGLDFYGRIVLGENPVVDGSLSGDDFKFKNQLFGPFLIKLKSDKEGLTFRTTKSKINAQGNIAYRKEGIEIKNVLIEDEDTIKISAKGSLGKDRSKTIDVVVDKLDPQIVDNMVGWGYSWTGNARGNVKISNDSKKGLGLTIYVTIDNGSINGIEFDVANGLISFKEDWVNLSLIDPLLISKTDKYDIELSGMIPVPMSDEAVPRMAGVPMDLKFQMKDGDLSVLKFLNFIDDAEGVTNVDLRIKGTKEFPSISGKVDISDGTVKLKYLFKELNHVYANLLISDNLINIYDCKGDTEKGTILIENLSEGKGGVMKFMKIHEVNWRITNIGDKIRFTDTPYFEYLRGDAEVDLAMTGLLESPFIKGTMKVSDFTYLYPVKNKKPTGEELKIKDEDNFAKKITWDMDVYGGENVKYYNNYLNNYADVILKIGDKPLKIQDKGNNIKITGNIRLGRGIYKYMNTEFKIDEVKESKVVFDGQMKPILDVYAVANFRKLEINEPNGQSRRQDTKVTLRTWGRVGNIKLELASEPALVYNERNRLLYIITFGRDVDPASSLSAGDFGKIANAVASFWIKKGGEQLQQYTPFDVLDIKVDVSDWVGGGGDAPGNTTTASESKERLDIGLGQYITDQLYVGYNLKLLEGTMAEELDYGVQQILGIEYSIDDTNKLIFEQTFSDPAKAYLGEAGSYIGIETNWAFDSWGTNKTRPKPEPTPTQ